MSHGIKILELLRANMRELGRKPSDIENASVIDQYLTVQAIKLKRVKKAAGMPKERARDAIFDALAAIDGQDLKQITRMAGSRLAGAKKQILEVMPDATIDQVVTEIQERAARYKSKFPTRERTAMALVGQWANLGGGPKTRAELSDVYKEPSGDWVAAASVRYGEGAAAAMKEQGWMNIGTDYRAVILKDMARAAKSA